MNSLSWFVYLIQVIPTFGAVTLTATIISLILYFIFWIARAIQYDGCYDRQSREYYEEVTKKSIKTIQKPLIYIFCISLILTVFLPKKETMVLIAASEVGEKVFASQTIKNIIDPSLELLQEWIKQELNQFKKAEKKSN